MTDMNNEKGDGDSRSTSQMTASGALIAAYWLPRWILYRTWELLRQDGIKGVESTVLWGGRRVGNEATVLSVLYPCGADVIRRRSLLRVGSDTTAEMGRWLRSHSQLGLIQVHTHPGEWTGHSETDNDFPIASSEGFVSVVWPRFAASPVRDAADLGVHRLIAGAWHQLPGDDATRLIRVVESEVMVWADPPGVATDRKSAAAYQSNDV